MVTGRGEDIGLTFGASEGSSREDLMSFGPRRGDEMQEAEVWVAQRVVRMRIEVR